jgi:small subunit ribosomal protein S1
LKNYTVNQKIKVKVLGIEPEKERISLGVKQLSDDPRASAIESLNKNDTVTGIVSDVREDGIEVTVNESFKSFIKKSDLARDRVDQRSGRFAIGDKVDAKIVSVDKVSHALTLSIKALEVDEQKDAIATYGSTDSGASLGDILGAALNSSNAAKEKKKKSE